MVEELVEATLPSNQDQSGITTKLGRNYLEQRTDKSEREASKHLTDRRTSFNTNCAHLNNILQDEGGRVTLSQPTGKKDPPKKYPTTIKT